MITPSIAPFNSRPALAAEIVPRLVPIRKIFAPGKRCFRSLTTAATSATCARPVRKPSSIPARCWSEGESTMATPTCLSRMSVRVRTRKFPCCRNLTAPPSTRRPSRPSPPGKSTATATGGGASCSSRYDCVASARPETVTISSAPAPSGAASASEKTRSSPALVIFFRVLDHLAVVRQLAGLFESNFAAQLGDTADAVGDSIGEAGALSAHFAAQGHAVGSARIVDDEPGFEDFRVAFDDLRHLRGMNEHAFDLGGLVGAAHPAADARIGAAAGAHPSQDRGKIARAEAYQGVVGVESRDHHLPHFAFGQGIARPRPHDFEDQRFVEDHALERFG